MLATFCRPKPIPTPNAPPNTDNTVKSIPTSGSAIKTAKTIIIVLMILDKIMVRLVSKLLLSKRSPIKRASHDAPIISSPTHKIPFKIIRRLSLPEPTEKLMASSISKILSSKPESQSTKPTHKTMETDFSSQSVSLFCGKAA